MISKICCGVPCLGLSSMSEGTCWPNCTLQDENHSGNGPRYVPGFLCRTSGKLTSLWAQKNSSKFDQVPCIRLSVLLNSYDKFLITCLSISFKSCVIYSSLVLGTFLSRNKLLLGCSSWPSSLRVAKFFLFLSVATWRKKNWAAFKTESTSYISQAI